MSKRKSKTGKSSGKATFLKDTPGWYKQPLSHVLLIFFFGFLLYANTFNHGYAQDDAIVIYDNEFTMQGIDGIRDILSYDTFRGFFKQGGKDKLVEGGRYRPLSLITFALEVEFFGKRPGLSHMFNGVINGLIGLVIYFFFLRLFRSKGRGHWAVWIALATALLFVAHPVHTEAVANIKGRDELLAFFFGFAALWMSLWSFDKKFIPGHLLAAALFFLGLLSKENTITLLAVVPLMLYYFRHDALKERKLPYAGNLVLMTFPVLLSSLAYLIIRGDLLGFELGQPTCELMNNPFIKVVGNDACVPFTFSEKMATIFYTLGKYVQLLVAPVILTHDYYPRHVEIMQFSDWEVMASVILYGLLTLVALGGLVRRSPLSFAIWMYLIPLSIVSNIVVNIGTNMSERFIFMPSLGFCLALAIIIGKIPALLAGKKGVKEFRQFRPALWLLLVVLLAYSVRTLLRNPDWKNNYTLFTTDVKVSQNSAKLRNAAGGELITQAIKPENAARREAMLQKAVEHLNVALKIHPYYNNAYLLLGNAHNYLKKYEEAIAYYQQALKITPGYEEALNNLAITYRDAGRYYGEQRGDLVKALQYLQEAYRMNPQDYETVRLLGVAYGVQGQPAKAIEYFKMALGLAPESSKADAYFNLGTAYYNAGLEAEGQASYQKAQELDPDIFNNKQPASGN